jgi:hypothetical protein
MITHVAIIYKGTIYSKPKPYRHHHIIHMIYDVTGENLGENEQGFLDDTGRFLNRKDALKHAVECGQIEKGNWEPNLFSEDVW